ncbi:MAG TPA: hypothetical protein VNZ22_11935 [Bacillota bacterium]|nr:hypothetical protein [Bacillota bacterium]
MRTLLKLCFVLLSAQGLAAEGAETNRPPAVLKIDDAHYVSSHGNRHPERYYIAPSPGIVLDAAGYAFKGTPPAPEGKTVDWIDLLRQKTDKGKPAGEGARYRLAWQPGKTQYELSPATLQPLGGAAPFEGFKAGERWFIFIGPTYQTNSLLALWSGVVEVR